MLRLIEDVSRAVQALQRRGRARALWEVPKDNSEGLVDWETRPIYDEYDEDETLVVAKQNPKSPHYFDQIQSHPSQHAMAILSEFIDDEKPTKPVPPPKPFNVVLEPEKPLGFLEAAVDFVSRESDLFTSDSVIRDVNSLVRTLKEKVDAEEKKRTAKAEAEEKKKTPAEVLKGPTHRVMDVNLPRRQNPQGGRIIGHGKIRGRIFSNKGRMMEAHETHEAHEAQVSDFDVRPEFSGQKRCSEQNSSLRHDVRWFSAV